MSRAATIQNRIRLFRNVINAMRERQLHIGEVAAILGYGPSGTRQVIRRMTEAGIILRTEHQQGLQITFKYELTGTPEDAEAFIESVRQAHATGDEKCAGKRNQGKPEIPSGRHIHLMQDDAPYFAKTVKAIPQADPILAALFGRAA